MELYPEDVPSMDNVYQSKYWETVKKDEKKKATDMFIKSRNPYETGVVPRPAYASMFQNIDNSPEQTSLTGNKMDNAFKHNNMQPFLKGNITQNTDLENFTSKLDMSTGTDKYYMHKTEVQSFFKPTSGLNNINGMKQETNFYKNRIELSKLKTDTFPIDKIHVGPGLNKGYVSAGSGGFQQNNTSEFARPKSLDELRSKINQKDTYYEIPFQGPVKGTEQRGVVAPYVKNKPERTYKQTEDQWMKTTGSQIKERERPKQIIKSTYRPESHTEYTGIVKSEKVKGLGTSDDYGKKNIIVYNNERQETQTRTVQTNITSIVKSIVAPVLDVLKHTIKEYTIDSARAGGNPKAQIPEKATIYDPVNHIMKTTVKETTVHESQLNNLTGPDESYMGNQDIAKTTIKETLIHDAEYINLKGQGANYKELEDKPKTTVKETLPVQDNVRNVGRIEYKTYVYDPDLVIKTTVKETTIKGKSEYGFFSGLFNSILGGYATKEIDLKNTNKQYTSDYEDYGVAQSISDYRQVSRDAEYNAEIDGTREQMLIDAGHTPNPGGMNIAIDKEDITMKSNKMFEDSIATRTTGNVGKIYQDTPSNLDECNLTTEITNKNNAFKNRLDSGILESLKKNDFNIGINPISDCVV